MILFVLHAPTFTPKDKIKLICLVAIALLYTAPWINYMAYHKTWTYDPLRVLFTVGYIPGEQYLFLLIQTVITTYLHMLISKLTLPILHIGKFGQSSLQIFLASYFVPPICLCLAYWGWQMAIPGTRTFYLVSEATSRFRYISIDLLTTIGGLTVLVFTSGCISLVSHWRIRPFKLEINICHYSYLQCLLLDGRHYCN